MSGTSTDHIAVCMCTYKRPQLLEKLLLGISRQETAGLFTYSVVVVDNDALQSAKGMVSSLREKLPLDIVYATEPEQNISLARNLAVRNAGGNYLAFIDDDEIPGPDWLLKLYNTCKEYKADGVLGPVKPHYEVEPPKWVVKARMHEKGHFETGHVLRKVKDTRTSNVLLQMRIFENLESPFGARYGRTGGEDTDFFSRMMDKGCVFVWCNEAPVYETIPPDRTERSYFLKRALLRGAVTARITPFSFMSISKSLLALCLYIPSLPVLQLAGHHLFMKYLMKSCDHIGLLLGTIGIDLVKERTW